MGINYFEIIISIWIIHQYANKQVKQKTLNKDYYHVLICLLELILILKDLDNQKQVNNQ